MSLRVSVLVANGSLDLAARAIMIQDFSFHLAVQDTATEFCCTGQMHRTRDACAVGWCRVSQRIMSRDFTEHAGALLALKLLRCM
jgi:hypothetical protein